MQQATTIDEMFGYLDELIATNKQRCSRLGYFPAVYRYVVTNLRIYYERGLLGDPLRIQQIALGLFNRYFAALQRYQAGELPTRAWLLAFEAAQSRWPTVGQQVMLSINPHINLDLGVVVAQSCPAAELPAFRDEFFAMNRLLAPLIVHTVDSLDQISPLFGLLGGKPRAALINGLVDRMGQHAWQLCNQLAPLGEAARAEVLAALDGRLVLIGRALWGASPALALFRLTERGTVPGVIELLTQLGEPNAKNQEPRAENRTP